MKNEPATKQVSIIKIARRGLVTAIIAAAAPAGTARAADVSPILNFDAAVVADSNITRSYPIDSQRDDVYMAAGVSYGKRLQAGPYDRYAITLDAKYSDYAQYGGMNNLRAGLTASYLHKTGIGRRAPWLRLHGSAARLEYREDARDGAEYELGAQAGSRVADWLELTAGYTHQDRTAPNNVYKGGGNTAAFSAGIALPRGFRLTAGYAVRRGDVTGHWEYKWPAWMPGMWVYTFGDRLAAYRVPGVTRISSVSVNYPLDDASSVFAGFERQGTKRLGKSYPNDIYRAGYARRYH